MNTPTDQIREDAEDEAVAWLVRLDAPEADEADWLGLNAWLETSVANREAFDRAERLNAELLHAAPELLRGLGGAPGASAAGLSLSTVSAVPPAAFARRPARAKGAARRMGRVVWSAAAGLAAALAVAVFVGLKPAAPVPAEIYQTAKGENRMVVLADGSRVHLNSGSRIAVRLQRDARRIEMAQGEAAFDVAKDSSRPFLITVSDRRIRVVGTEFNVLNASDRLRVTVRRGIVGVAPVTSPETESAVLLRAGDEFDHTLGARVSEVRKVDPEVAFAWRRGNLVYRDQPLGEVVGDLNRYFETPVRVIGPAAALRFSGVLVIDGEEAVVGRLQAFLPITVDKTPGAVTLRQR